jgi:hypothetical protein
MEASHGKQIDDDNNINNNNNNNLGPYANCFRSLLTVHLNYTFEMHCLFSCCHT